MYMMSIGKQIPTNAFLDLKIYRFNLHKRQRTKDRIEKNHYKTNQHI